MDKLAQSVLASVMVICVVIPIAIYSQETTGLFEQPLLITSAGQNAEVQIAAVLAKRAGLNYSISKLAGPQDLANVKSLVIVLGASLKGLGAAGLDMDKENDRLSSLLAAAQKDHLPILGLHLGGEVRRGPQTDELIARILPLTRLVIVVKSGNADGFFTRICGARNIPLIEVEKTADAQIPLQKAFK